MTKQLFCILGMHRSGTSLVTRAVHALGAQLGARLMPAHETNPTGFWEDLDVVECNQRVLVELGLAWDTPTVAPMHAAGNIDLQTHKARIRGILRSKCAEANILAIKDPRLCLVLPLWMDAAADVGAEVRLVVSVRNPLDVAQSLSVRDGFSRHTGLVLWRNYCLQIAKYLEEYPVPRLFVGYNALVDNVGREMERLGAFVLGEGAGDDAKPAIEAFISEFVDRNLRHSLSTREELEAIEAAVPGTTRLFEFFERSAEQNPGGKLPAPAFRSEELLAWELDNYVLARDVERSRRKAAVDAKAREVLGKCEQAAAIKEKELAARHDAAVSEVARKLGQEIRRVGERKDREIEQLREEFERLQKLARREADVRLRSVQVEIQSLSKLIGGATHASGARPTNERGLEAVLKEREELVEQLQRMDHEVNALRGSWSWRITAPLRAVMAFPLRLRNLVHLGSRRLLPLHGIAGAGPQWRATDDDPAFLLDLPPRGLRPGWYRVRVIGSGLSGPQLFLDTGADFNEAETHALQQQSTGYQGDLRTYQTIKRLRFDPRTSPGDFTIEQFSIERRAWARVLFEAAMGVYRRERRAGKGTFGIVSEKWRIARSVGLLEMMRHFDRYTLEFATPHEGFGEAIDYQAWIEGVEAKYLQRLGASAPESFEHRTVVLGAGARVDDIAWTLESLPEDDKNVLVLVDADQLDAARARWTGLTVREFGGNELKGVATSGSGTTITLVTPGWRTASRYPAALAEALRDHSPSQFLAYSDSDLLSEEGKRHSPELKPDWSPDYLLEHDYIGGVISVSAGLLAEAVRQSPPPAKLLTWWLAARIATANSRAAVIHVPFVLAHRREDVPAVPVAGKVSYLNELLAKWNAHAGAQDGVNCLRVVYAPDAQCPTVTVVVPTRDRVDLLRQCIGSLLETTDYPNFNVIIVDNGSESPETLRYFENIQSQSHRVRVITYPGAFNFAGINNFAVQHSDAELICFLNNDIEIVDAGWLTVLAGYFVRGEVGCVGSKLLYPNGKVQHGGVLLGLGGVAGHAFTGADPDEPGYGMRLRTVQNYSAVTAACMLTRRTLFEELNGFEEHYLPVAFNDVDYCLRVVEKGSRVLWCPHTHLVHHESASRKPESERIAEFTREIRFMKARWGVLLERDPAYNPHLSLKEAPFALAKRWAAPGTSLTAPGETLLQQRYAYESNLDRIGAVVKGPRAFHNRGPFSQGLSIVILNLNKPELIGPLLDNLVAAKRNLLSRNSIELQIIVGDTGSTDPEVFASYSRHSGDVLVAEGMRYHFSRCNNDLFERFVTYDKTLFLNNDVVFNDAAQQLKLMANALDGIPLVGIVGARLLYPDGRLQHGGIEIFREGELKGLCFHPRHAQNFDYTHIAIGGTTEYPAVTGACLMIRSDLFLDCFGFEEGYLAEAQDVDLCLKARRLGFQTRLAELGKIVHFENATRRKGEASNHDRAKFIRKWNSFVETHF